MRVGPLVFLVPLLGSCATESPIRGDTRLFDPASNTWSAGPALPEPVTGHTATLLEDGSVLLAGGDSIETVGDLFRCDANMSSCTALGSLREYHDRAEAVLLPDGRVLLAGGVWSGDPELVAPLDGSSALTPRASMEGSQLASLPDGRVLARGPYAESSIFDPSTNAWSNGPDPLAARDSLDLVTLDDDRVLAIGGYEDDARRTGEVLDPTTMTWSAITPMNGGHSAHTASLLLDGRVLVLGGTERGDDIAVEIYDPSTDTWTPVESEHTKRIGHRATVLEDGRVLITGGELVVENGYDTEPTWMIFDPTSSTWTSASDGLSRRIYHTATLLPDGRVLVAGGDIGYLDGRLE